MLPELNIFKLRFYKRKNLVITNLENIFFDGVGPTMLRKTKTLKPIFKTLHFQACRTDIKAD